MKTYNRPTTFSYQFKTENKAKHGVIRSQTALVIAQRKFGNHYWELFRVFPNWRGPFTVLREEGGQERQDYPVRYATGRVVYDSGNIPKKVMEWVEDKLNDYSLRAPRAMRSTRRGEKT